MIGSGPQSKLGAGAAPAGDEVPAGNFFNFGDGPCLDPLLPIIRRRGPASCEGSPNEAGFQGCEDSEKESNPNPRLGTLSSPLTTGFCGVVKATGAAGAVAAFVLRRGCCRADSKARLSLCADSSPFRAFAALTTEGAVLYGRLGSGSRRSRGDERDAICVVFNFFSRDVSRTTCSA